MSNFSIINLPTFVFIFVVQLVGIPTRSRVNACPYTTVHLCFLWSSRHLSTCRTELSYAIRCVLMEWAARRMFAALMIGGLNPWKAPLLLHQWRQPVQVSRVNRVSKVRATCCRRHRSVGHTPSATRCIMATTPLWTSSAGWPCWSMWIVSGV